MIARVLSVPWELWLIPMPQSTAAAGAIRALGDPNLAAGVRLTGSCQINQYIDINDLLGNGESFKSSFGSSCMP